MKHLLNTLFVTSEDIYLSLDGENVVANREHQEIAPPHIGRDYIVLLPGSIPRSHGCLCAAGHLVGILYPPGTLLGPRYRSKFGKCTASPYPVPNRR